MKSIIKFLSNPLIMFMLSIYIALMIHSNRGFFITYSIMAFPATILIYTFNWKYYTTFANKNPEVKFKLFDYIIAFFIDVLVWPFTLIVISNAVLQSETITEQNNIK